MKKFKLEVKTVKKIIISFENFGVIYEYKKYERPWKYS